MYTALITTPMVCYTGDPEGTECVPFWFSYIVYPYGALAPQDYEAVLGYN